MVKKTEFMAYNTKIKADGIIAIKVRDGDELVGVRLTSGEEDLLLVSKSGHASRFREKLVRPMGRDTSGVRGMNVSAKIPGGGANRVLAMDIARDESELFVVTENGYGKRTAVAEYPVKGRGTKGVLTAKLTAKKGGLAGALIVREHQDLLFISQNGMVQRTQAGGISQMGRATQGVRVMNMKEDDRVSAVALVVESGASVADEPLPPRRRASGSSRRRNDGRLLDGERPTQSPADAPLAADRLRGRGASFGIATPSSRARGAGSAATSRGRWPRRASTWRSRICRRRRSTAWRPSSRSRGVQVEHTPADLTDADERRRLAAWAEEALGPIDILVNNAGIEFGGPFAGTTEAELEAIVAVNLLAVMDLTRLMLPGMLERRRGHVVNIASLAGKAPSPYLASYSATKHGVVGFTHALRAEHGREPVGFSAICPVFISRVGMYGRIEDQHRGAEPDWDAAAGAGGRGRGPAPFAATPPR